MRIMSLNAWGGALFAPLIAYLRAEQPDILCLQEVVHTPQAGRDWLTYRDGDHVLPQRANLFAEVSAALPGHGATFCPAAQGELWDGDTAVPSFWGLATFLRHGLQVVAQAQGFVHGAYSPDGYGAHPRSRPAHVVRIHDPASGGMLCVGHMHGLRDPAGKRDTPARLAQARRFAGLAARVAEPGDPLVLCGDFNVEPDSATFAVLGELGLADLVVARGFAGTRTSRYARPGRFADYMLVNDRVAVRDFAVVREPEVSDHCALVLTM